MNYIFLILISIFAFQAHGRVSEVFVCPIDTDFKVELSLMDKNEPSVELFNKKSKIGTCLYKNTIFSRPRNENAQVISDKLRLKLDSCRYYFEDQKNKIAVMNDVTFIKTKGRSESYLRIVEGLQPLRCTAKK